jgi:hypothetical protein
LFSTVEEGFVQSAAGEAEAGEGQRRLDFSAVMDQAEFGYFSRTQALEVDFEVGEGVLGFVAEEFAADLVGWGGLAFEQQDAAAGTGDEAGRRTSGQAAAGNQQWWSHLRRLTQ